MIENIKHCNSCDNDLPATIEHFYLRNRSKDGFTSECKLCKKEYDKKRRENNKEKMKEKSKEMIKNRTEEQKLKVKERTRKWREDNKEHLAEYAKNNKEKQTEYNKKYWQENKEKSKENVSEWRKENKERIKKYRKDNSDRNKEKTREWYATSKGNTLSRLKTNSYRAQKRELESSLTPKEWNDCVEWFLNSCAYCGEEKKLEQEHFIPVTKNGPFTKENIVAACRSCNASKFNTDFNEWYHEQSFYSYERERKILEYLGADKNEFIV